MFSCCLLLQAPVKANGKILAYNLNISQGYEMLESHYISVDTLTQTYSMVLPAGKTASIELTMNNSVGVSPKATLIIPRSDDGMLKPAVVLSLWFCSVVPLFLIKNVL